MKYYIYNIFTESWQEVSPKYYEIGIDWEEKTDFSVILAKYAMICKLMQITKF